MTRVGREFRTGRIRRGPQVAAGCQAFNREMGVHATSTSRAKRAVNVMHRISQRRVASASGPDLNKVVEVVLQHRRADTQEGREVYKR